MLNCTRFQSLPDSAFEGSFIIKKYDFEEESMKKIIAMVLVAGFFAGLIGCGNSTDGDSQKPNDGEYGRMSPLYGPAGDGKSSR